MTLVVSNSLMSSFVCSACQSSESGPLTRELYCSCGITSGQLPVECLAGVTPFVACGVTFCTEEEFVAENAVLLKMAHVVRAKRAGLRRNLVGGVTLGGELLTLGTNAGDDIFDGGRDNTACGKGSDCDGETGAGGIWTGRGKGRIGLSRDVRGTERSDAA